MDLSLSAGAILWLCLTAILAFIANAVLSALSSRKDFYTADVSGKKTAMTVREREEKQLTAWIVHFVFLFLFVLTCLRHNLCFQTFLLALAVVFLAGELPALFLGRCFPTAFVWTGEILFALPYYLFRPFFRMGRKRRARAEKALEETEKSGNTELEEEDDDTHIFKGITGFSEIETCQIMKPRMDIVALPISSPFSAMMETVRESEYSRLPVYDGDLDHIKGILYVKDLLPYLDRKEDFSWQKLVRPAIFVPETRKIEQLLKEFKKKRLHLAVVVDDYGGTSGIVTLEDILEELVGEINDEFDTLDEKKLYQKLDSENYLFDGRMPIHDLCKLLDVDDDYFDIEEGDYESVAGLILEITGYFPPKGTQVVFKNFTFTVEATGENRITRIKMTIADDEQE